MSSHATPPPGALARSGRRLIVNADDFGLSSGVNAGIIQAHTTGILTSATILANAPAFSEAVALAKAHPRLGVGLHLNLVRGPALSPAGSAPLVADADGRLRPFRLRRCGRAFLSQAEGEYRRQFEKALAAGLRPTHVDFEKHHAWQKPLYELASTLAAEYRILAIRTLREPVIWSLRALGWPGARRTAMACLLRCGWELAGPGGTPLASPDRLLGQTHIGGMTETVWLRLLARLPAGTSEVMVHPGCGDDAGSIAMGGGWLNDRRRLELDALVSDKVGRAAAGIELITFRDLA